MIKCFYSVEDESVDKGNGTSEDAGVKCPGTLAKEKHKAACMVIIKNFGPKSFNEHVKSVLTSQKNMRKVVYPVQGRENNVAAIIMKSKRDALKAAKQIDKMKISGEFEGIIILCFFLEKYIYIYIYIYIQHICQKITNEMCIRFLLSIHLIFYFGLKYVNKIC